MTPEPFANRLRLSAEHYTPGEAAAMLGRHYRATRDNDGVPAGTIGVVDSVYNARDGIGLNIQWIRPGRPPLVDGFSRRDMELVLDDGSRPMQPVACRVCGCTDDRACAGGCTWTGPDLCSNCGTGTIGGDLHARFADDVDDQDQDVVLDEEDLEWS